MLMIMSRHIELLSSLVVRDSGTLYFCHFLHRAWKYRYLVVGGSDTICFVCHAFLSIFFSRIGASHSVCVYCNIHCSQLTFVPTVEENGCKCRC